MSSEFIDISTRSVQDNYKLMVGLIGPRPIGWISTVGRDGVFNLAPYSFFNLFSNNPLILGFSAARTRDGRRKDSLINAEASGEFVHNVVTKNVAEPMNLTSEEIPLGESEFTKADLTPIPSRFVKAPRVKEAAVNIECKLDRIVSFGDKPGNGELVLGKVVAVHINDTSILGVDGLVDSRKLQLISRLGKTDYLDFGEIFSLSRPS